MIKTDQFKSFLKPKETKIETQREIWGYTRVSTKQQIENYSIEEQDESIRLYATRKKYLVADMIGGTYESASGDFTRKEFTKLMNAIKQAKKRPYAIATSFINRFSRTGGGAISIVDDLIKDYNVHLVETSTGLCTDNPAEKLEIYRKLLEAQKWNQDKLAITVPGMKRFLNAGNKLGKAPFGYTTYGPRVKDFDRKQETQEVKINEQGEVLKKAWRWKLAGEKDYVIRQRMADMGVKISTQTLSEVWRKPHYCGILINNLLNEARKGNWEPMITQEQFFRVQEMLAPSKAESYKVENRECEKRPLARFLVCATCNTPLTGYEVKKKKVHYYKCNYCKGVSMNANTTKGAKNIGLNNSFQELLKTVSLKEPYIKLFEMQLRKMFYELNDDTEVELKSQRKLLVELKDKLEKLEEKYLFGEIAVKADVYTKHTNDIEAKIQRCNDNIVDLEGKLSNHENFINKAIDVCKNISKYWGSGDFKNKERIQNVLFEDGLPINPQNRQYLTNNINQIFKITACISSGYEFDKNEKVDNDADFSRLVARTGIEPVTFGL